MVPVRLTRSRSCATINSYSSSDNVYLMAQTASFVVSPASSTGTYGVNSDYSAELFLGPGQWIIAALNGDSANNVTANVTVDKINSIV